MATPSSSVVAQCEGYSHCLIDVEFGFKSCLEVDYLKVRYRCIPGKCIVMSHAFTLPFCWNNCKGFKTSLFTYRLFNSLSHYTLF